MTPLVGFRRSEVCADSEFPAGDLAKRCSVGLLEHIAFGA